VLCGEVATDELPLPTAAGFKLPKRVNEQRFKAYTVYAHYLALLVLQATTDHPVHPIPRPAAKFRAAVLDQFGAIDFPAVLKFVWRLGIPVLPLADPGAFHGAVWRTNGRNVIVIKQQPRRLSLWLVNLLHEVDHASEAPEKAEHTAIDTDTTDTADPEAQATQFAADVVLDGRAEELVTACVNAAQGSVELLKKAVPRVARDFGVDVGVLANYLAYRLSFQETRPGSQRRINWWPTATNLQPPGPDPWVIARDQLFAAADLGALNPVDRSLLSQALTD
jgi:Zn-dependent peptidase ImmA (M78 family)